MTRFCSIFSQLLQLFPRIEFQQAVSATKAERHARGFTCWGQFVAMLFCQLGRAHSLREICGGLASCEGKLAHLGIEAPSRTTLAYANAHRPWPLYELVFYQLLARCREVAGSHRFRFKNPLVSLDATVIDLCAEMFPWATFRRTKGAVTLHFTLDHDGYLPTALVITEGKRHEVTVARQQTFAPGTILVFDRGYLDFAWFNQLTDTGVWFVTRMKESISGLVSQVNSCPSKRMCCASNSIGCGRIPHAPACSTSCWAGSAPCGGSACLKWNGWETSSSAISRASPPTAIIPYGVASSNRSTPPSTPCSAAPEGCVTNGCSC